MQCVLVPCHFGVFTFSPSSTRRRMASGRDGVSSCLPPQSSTVPRNSFDSLIAVTGSWPVAGRDPVTAIRLSKELRGTVDDWGGKQDDTPSRPEAIRRLVELGLKVKTPK